MSDSQLRMASRLCLLVTNTCTPIFILDFCSKKSRLGILAFFLSRPRPGAATGSPPVLELLAAGLLPLGLRLFCGSAWTWTPRSCCLSSTSLFSLTSWSACARHHPRLGCWLARLLGHGHPRQCRMIFRQWFSLALLVPPPAEVFVTKLLKLIKLIKSQL